MPHSALTPSPPPPLPPSSEIPSVSPRAREAAAAAGLDWKALTIPGTGFEGMIVERDIEALLRQAEEARPRVTPLAAKLAAEMGVPAGTIEGTGPGRRITAEDVRRHPDRATPGPASSAPA